MFDSDVSQSAIWALLVFQLVGLLSVFLTRMSSGTAHRASCHWLFFACLALMGVFTMGAMAIGPGITLLLGFTFSIMVISAVWDVGPASI